MTEEVQTNEAPEATVKPEDIRLPIVLSLPEIQGLLGALRKFPMEQVEGIVVNIQSQANALLAQMKSNETGETK